MASVLESIARRGFRDTCEALFSTEHPIRTRASEPRPKYAHLRRQYQGGRSGRASIYKVVGANKDRQGQKTKRYKKVGDGSLIDDGESDELVTVKMRAVRQHRESKRPSRIKDLKPDGSRGGKRVTRTVTEDTLGTDGRQQTKSTKTVRHRQTADDRRQTIACHNSTSSPSSSSPRQTGSVPSRRRSNSYITCTGNQVEGRTSRSRQLAQLVATRLSELHTATNSSGPDALSLDSSEVGRSGAIPRRMIREQPWTPVPARTSASHQKPGFTKRTVRIVEDVEMTGGKAGGRSNKPRESSSPFQQPAMSPKESQDLVFGKTPRSPAAEGCTMLSGRVLETVAISSSAEHRSDDDEGDDFDDIEDATENPVMALNLDGSLPDLTDLVVADEDGYEPHLPNQNPHTPYNYTSMQAASFTAGSQHQHQISAGHLAPPVQLPTPEISPLSQLDLATGSRPFASATVPVQRTQGTHSKKSLFPGRPRRH